MTYFVYPFICDGHLGCFHLLASANNAAVLVYKFLFEHLFSTLWGIHLGVELLDHMVILCLIF